jgi:hypothetical protein
MNRTRLRAAKRFLYLEDLHDGQCFTSGAHTWDKDHMIAFASEFDPQPFHLDAAAAKNNLFGGLVAGYGKPLRLRYDFWLSVGYRLPYRPGRRKQTADKK